VPRRTLFAFVLALGAACGSTRTYVPDPGPYDQVPDTWRAELSRARDLLEAGDARAAHDLVRPLAAQRPALLPVRVFLQELQVRLLADGERVGGFGLPQGQDPATALGDLYLERADANPSTAEYVLAARLTPSGDDALRMLARAREEDPGCVWVHYATAWWNAKLRRFPEAREAVAQAFERDPGHLPTMRLHATLLAGAGDVEPAVLVLGLWLERTAGDPLTDPSQRAEAEVDLAALRLLEADPSAALEVLAGVDKGALLDPARAELVRAVALEDVGQRPQALAAARRARDDAPDDLLPLVHQAMLLGAEGNTTQERQIWELLLEVAERRASEPSSDPAALDIADLVIRLRANARLQRLREQDGARWPRPAGDVRR